MATRPASACQTPTMIIMMAANTVKPTAQPLTSPLAGLDRDTLSLIRSSSPCMLFGPDRHQAGRAHSRANPPTGPARGPPLFGMKSHGEASPFALRAPRDGRVMRRRDRCRTVACLGEQVELAGVGDRLGPARDI